MQSKLTLIGIFIVLISGCRDPQKFVSNKHYFKKDYSVSNINAPKYPFKSKPGKETITISFPKQGEYTIHLTNTTCGGRYTASKDGTITFTGTNCTAEQVKGWDHYILTLLRKARRYEGGDRGPLYLYIDQNNYMVLNVDLQDSIMPSDE